MVNLKVIAPGIQGSSSSKEIIHIKRFPMVMVQVHEAPFLRSHSTMLKFLQCPSVRVGFIFFYFVLYSFVKEAGLNKTE